MVGIVIVAHSRILAEALVALVKQMSGPEVPIAIAAGAGPEGQEFGTNAMEITEAIQSVYDEDGVLILMDLGSAILSAEMALELLPAEMQAKVRFCAAPLVEGAIAAGVQAGLGSDLERVCREAREALIPKAKQLGEVGTDAETAPPVEEEAVGEFPPEEVVLRLKNEHGLHARPAALFVREAARFDAEVQVRNLSKGKGPVSAKSLNALATLGAVYDDEIALTAQGPDAEQVLAALNKLVESKFNQVTGVETGIQPPPGAQTPIDERAMQGVPISEGVAIGPMYKFHLPPPQVEEDEIRDPQQGWDRLLEAIEITRKAIRGRYQSVRDKLGTPQAAIFEAHLLILEDPDLLERARELVFENKRNEGASWREAINEVVDDYKALPDVYLQQRASDVLDVGNQVLYALAGEKPSGKVEFPERAILFANELTPTQTAQLEIEQVLGFVTVAGGPTSHSAILARTMGIPAIAGADPELEMLPEGTLLAIDGSTGALWVDPPQEKLAELREQRDKWIEQQERLRRAIDQPAVTQDGHRIEVAVNVGSVLDAELGMKNKAEGIGLLRTEFLFLQRDTAPSEAEQMEALSEIGRIMAGKPMVVRTLDVGGDKTVPYIQLPHEENPFLGVRAIRLSLQEEALFRTQLRAILRVGADFNIRVMFPMVADPGEVKAARGIMESVHEALEAEGAPHAWPMETGIMVEIPSAALLSSIFAQQVDFFSIGTNDLTQYTLAAERGNPALSEFADGLHPAVLRLIQQVVTSSHQAEKWVGVCGELAGDPSAVPVLVGLGVDELSMNPGSIARAKALIRSIKFSEAQKLAQEALDCESAEDVRRMAKGFVEGLRKDEA
ncbi:MAG TPA: phosphoenolpyruvate--protein phosphotransferase [Anaerolineales bacterium]